ncbi:MAG: hypothetical protein IMF10_06215 [Proteobacteria bacterium]|nr:hypothetical protein [Pseudomonadota bacterium]
MEARERTHIITGGVILITLGVLIFLNSMDIYGFGKSWPILLIVVSVCTLVQRTKDIGGWIIGIVGVVFLVVKNFQTNLDKIAGVALPALLVLLGVYILFNHFRKRR